MRKQTLYLCPSDRAARAFRRRLASTATALPDCIDFDRFCRDLWQRARLFGRVADDRELLDHRAAAMLWRHIVADGGELSRSETGRIAALAADAWNISHQHGFSVTRIAAFADGSDNLALFARYSAAMQALLRRHRLLTTAELPAELGARISQLSTLLPARIVLTPSFTSNPARQAFLEAMQAMGIEVKDWLPDRVASGPVQLHRFQSEAAERQAAIVWAAEQLATSDAGVTLVVPDLSSKREAWLSALRRQFVDDTWIVAPERDRECFNLSIGPSVGDYPHIASLLAAVRASHSAIDTEQLMQALVHPRWGRSDDEIRQLQNHGLKLLDLGIDRSMLHDWREVLPEPAIVGADLLAFGPQSRALHAVALARLTNVLTRRALIPTSELYQLEETWASLQQAWSESDRWLPPQSWAAAVRELDELAAAQVFQPLSGRARLQVVGLLESAGVPTGALWITGLTDQVLPERLKPSPMLARAWQSEAQAGLGSVEEVALRARRLWRNWQMLSANVMVSYAADIEGSPQRPSPLLRTLPETVHRDETPVSVPALQALGSIVDEHLTAMAPGAIIKPLSARALEDQAQCPRRAAAVRLGLKEWPEHAVAISQRLRGTLVHEVMAALGTARQSAGQHQADEALLLARSLAVLDAAFERERALRPQVPALAWAVERRRIEQLVQRVLRLEASRGGFAVESVESGLQGEIDGMPFALRADRIDRVDLADGDALRVVFDYKTGRVGRNDWFAQNSSGRLAAPQLPLYALLLNAQPDALPVRALAYIIVSDDDCKFVAVGEDAALVKSRDARQDAPWDQLLAEWRAQVSDLVGERSQGVALVAPLNGERTCRYCAFGSFCREPWSMTRDEGEADGGEDAGDE